MSEINEEKEKELELLHKAIFIENSIVLPELINRLKSFESPKTIDLLVEKLANDNELEQEAKQSIITFFRELKSDSAIERILFNIKKFIGTNTSSILLMVCWEGLFENQKYLSSFAEFAVLGNYADAIEVLSIFDSIEQIPEDKEIIKSKMYFLDYLKENPDSEKSPLIQLLLDGLNSF